MFKSKRRPKRKSKRHFKRRLQAHWDEKKHLYARVLVILLVLVAVVWAAEFLVKKEGDHAVVVKELAGSPVEKYEEAMALVEAGDVDKARMMMVRLARLGDSADRPLGYGPAHLWVAQELLKQYDPRFLSAFPGIEREDARRVMLTADGKTEKAQRHLEHAVALNPESEDAALLLAAVRVSMGQRNSAVEVLLNAVSHSDHPHPSLHVQLAHVLSMQGDDLALKERALYLLSTFGSDSGIRGSMDISERVSYVVSALILKKYEIANVAIQRLEARYGLDPLPADMLEDQKRVLALRAAYHYHKAIGSFSDAQSDASADYSSTIDDLEKVLVIAPETKPAVDALSYIANQDKGRRTRVESILKKIMANGQIQDARVRSAMASALASSLTDSNENSREYLTSAVEADPRNIEATIRLMKLMSEDKDPDYEGMAGLARKALNVSRPDQKHDIYLMLGLSQLRLNQSRDAVVSLELALSGNVNKPLVHQLLAEAYAALGKTEIAEAHKAMISKEN